VISTAIKQGKAESAWIDAAVRSMTTLNQRAAEVITGHAGPGPRTGQVEQGSTVDPRGVSKDEFAVNAMTDVTGFGLIGHAREMVLASDVSITISAAAVPLLEGALECVRAGCLPGGLKNNRDFAECLVEYDQGVPADVRALLFDPQTAGGLLISVAADHSTRLTEALNAAGVPAVKIGDVSARAKPLIRVK
jgi:selenide,water dikinase